VEVFYPVAKKKTSKKTPLTLTAYAARAIGAMLSLALVVFDQ